MEPVLPPSRIGIIGGGQLGRMLALEAKRMGYFVYVMDPSENSPASQVADECIVAELDDVSAALKLSKSCAIVTYEFENIHTELVSKIEKTNNNIFPSSEVLKITQNRILEKKFVQSTGVKVTEFCEVKKLDECIKIGFPAIIKTASGGYDGKGQRKVKSVMEAENAIKEFGKQQLIWEKMVPFKKELSIICARNKNNEISVFPLVENIHKNHILHMTIAPARVSEKTKKSAQKIAISIAKSIDLIGIICIELFMLKDGTLLVNELAPRPHNSGHHTIESCNISQFEQHIRAVCNLPLAKIELKQKACMINILGTGEGNQLIGIEKVLTDPNVKIHLYGKTEAKKGRKMGHITAVGNSLTVCLRNVNKARKELKI